MNTTNDLIKKVKQDEGEKVIKNFDIIRVIIKKRNYNQIQLNTSTIDMWFIIPSLSILGTIFRLFLGSI